MDKHIVRGDEVGNDDDSLDDNHVSLFVIKLFLCNSSWVHAHEVGILLWLGPDWCVFYVIRSKVVCGLQFDDVPPVAGHRWGTMGRMLSMRNPYIVLFNKLSTNLALVMGQSNCYRWCLLLTGSTCWPISTLYEITIVTYLLMCISLFCWSTSSNIILLCLNHYSIIIFILMLPCSMMWYNSSILQCSIISKL
jgi:hypothetical protein